MTDTPRKTPNPGSDDAQAIGCSCPVLDNGRGRGDGNFWMDEGCPVHGAALALAGGESTP